MVLVAIHWVPVPVVIRMLPAVPEALVASNQAPVSRMLPATDKSWAGVVVPKPRLP